MISELVLKYLKGQRFVIRKSYSASCSAASQGPLTAPAGKSLAEIAVSTVRSEPYIRTRIPFAFLAPRLQATILDGHQPPDLSVARLLREGIPADWTLQLRLFAVT